MRQMLNHEQLLRMIRDRMEHPATPRELQQRLKIPREDRGTLSKLLKDLTRRGDLVETRGNRYGLPDRMNLVVGRITTHPRGFGFVAVERGPGPVSRRREKTPSDDPRKSFEERQKRESGPGPVWDGDLYIAGSNLNQAMHGDRVVARVERIGSDGRAEGRIVRILERASSTIVGKFDLDASGYGFVLPFDRRLIMDVGIPSGDEAKARPGDMVLVEITRWPTPARGPLGRVTEVLGDIDAPGVDTEIIIRKYGIRDEHAQEAIDQAVKLGSAVREKDLKNRTDFRPLTTVTIDGEHARDFDDAITLDRLPDGSFWLGVHIADVAHYVEEGSALDEEAYERATSVYFPERAVHMFPAQLSTGLCSLNPRVDRLVQSCLMEIDRQGAVVRYELHDGVINSNERMTYTDVNAILTDRDADAIARYEPLMPLFERMRELFEILNRRRRRRGSIDFDLKEPEIVLDDEGMVEKIIALERNVAHRIIEEFMLVANETVAEHLSNQDVATLYRIHEDPDPLKVAEFEEFIGTLGYGLGTDPEHISPKHFQKLVDRMRGTPEEKPIAFLMLRTMQKARYDPENLGHFGLAASSYTHFTSPIRRYPDLVVHRTLRESRHGLMDQERTDQLAEDMPEIARHTSERERRADDAERELVQWKKVRFMADKVGDEFDGYVTGVSAFGLYIELIEHFVEGMVHVSTMADDYYRFVEKAHLLKGENTGKVYRLGDRVTVQVIRVDMERRQVDLGLSEILERVRESEENRGPRRSRAQPKREAHLKDAKGEKRKQRPGKKEREERRRAR
ncbi:MAG TPA: ribonuclease R [Vicinamibacterales bacterium]|nr:ribonuclease R [Vicinamibacterales bacterium]